MNARVILNPYSNRWTSEKRWPEAEAALQRAGMKFDLAVSSGPGDIAALARQAVLDGCQTVIAAGGDGTIGEMVNSMAHTVPPDGPMPMLGILPMGTANDLAYALKIPFELPSAAAVIAAGKFRRMDLGCVNDIYFANNSALGLEPYVGVIQNKIGWIKGIGRYLVAAVRAIMDGPNWQGHLEWDSGSFDGPLSLVYIGNGPRSGGLFYMAPHADPLDGKLTVVYGHRPTRAGMFALLPKAMRPGAGSYVESPGVKEFTTEWLKVRLENPSPAHTDGEIFTTAITELEYTVFPSRLQVLLP